MNIALWIVQILLALVFTASALPRLFLPIEQLPAQMAWALDVNPLLMVRLPAFAEILGAIGLIVPSVVRIQPKLTVWAAYGLALVMVLAVIFHITRGEYGNIVSNIVLLALSLFVAYGRSKLVPIAPRQ